MIYLTENASFHVSAGRIWAILAGFGCAGCAAIPHPDPDLACTIRSSSETQALAMMQTQSTTLSGNPFTPQYI
jgi:hypothetical protein